MKRIANANWKGTGMQGVGSLTTQSKVFTEQPYSFKTRFQNEEGTLGTNPEELIAAAHAGCFNMALSFQLEGAGYIPKELDTEATIFMDKVEGHFKIIKISLSLKATIEDIEEAKFQESAKNAKEHCPVSQALASVEIILKAELNQGSN